MGWHASSKQLFDAEQGLVRQLEGSDVSARLFTINALDRFGRLHPTTIGKLNEMTKTGPDPVAIAALNVLAHHARESRGLQWEIYKLQQNNGVSSVVRSQAGVTVEELKKYSPRQSF